MLVQLKIIDNNISWLKDLITDFQLIKTLYDFSFFIQGKGKSQKIKILTF